MGPLIKITTEPLQMVRFTQNARLVSSDSVDMERRKALARHIAAQRSNPQTQSTVSVEELTRINRTFSPQQCGTAGCPDGIVSADGFPANNAAFCSGFFQADGTDYSSFRCSAGLLCCFCSDDDCLCFRPGYFCGDQHILYRTEGRL